MKIITKNPEIARKAYYHGAFAPITRAAIMYPIITPKGAESNEYANFLTYSSFI